MTQMGDISHSSTSDARAIDQNLPSANDTGGAPPNHSEQQKAAEYGTQPQSYLIASHQTFAPQFDMFSSSSVHRPGPYNMGPMANALPPVAFRPGQYPHSNQQRYPIPNSPSVMQQIPQFVGHQAVPVHGQGYYVQQPHMGQYYGAHFPHSQNSGNIPPRQNMTYYPNQMMINQQQSTFYYPPAHQYPPTTHAMPNAMMPGQYVNGNLPTPNDSRATSQSTGSIGTQQTPPKQVQVETERRQSAVRGPPRKPRQSGHAIWIGNLPPQTDLMSLVYHVCKEATGLESLFLISKSNCAFANFKNETTCIAAQQKLHDSKFQSVRLVSRLRKSTVEGAAGMTAPTGPAIVTSNPSSKIEQTPGSPPTDPPSSKSTPEQIISPKKAPADTEGSFQKDKFFVLKSLTVEDLELSVRTGIWATQSHNEDTLNTAFKSSDNVYLVFSANKSGEYFGYARMVSEINEDPAAAIEFAPKAPSASDLDLPKAIPTEATEDAPKGRIIDDSARGTIFWEAERDESDGISDTESVSSDKSTGAEEGPTKTWGKPFKLEWQSTTHLPFYRTRGLRNPWNSNREVKIARDGTELEPSVGRRLIGLFNRVQSPTPATAPMQVSMAVMSGFPQMGPYGQ